MTTITIADNICWRCGEKKGLTMHHTIPKHLKPVNNILVPICEDCHKDITADDIAGLYAYVSKLEKTVKDLTKQIKGIMTTVENQSLIKIKKKIK